MFCAQRNGGRDLETPAAVLIESLSFLTCWDVEIEMMSKPVEEIPYWRWEVFFLIIASITELDPGTFHCITFQRRGSCVKGWIDFLLVAPFLFSKGQLLQHLTSSTAGRWIVPALSNVRPKPRANTKRTQSFLIVSLEKVSSPPGRPDAGWCLMVSEPVPLLLDQGHFFVHPLR